jgi:hypothetical protein
LLRSERDGKEEHRWWTNVAEVQVDSSLPNEQNGQPCRSFQSLLFH